MRILFITATRLGDAVLSTGVLDHLLHVYPQASFTVACGPVAAGVFARMPRLERLIVVDKRRYDLHWLSLWSKVARTRWDLTVDLRGSGLTLALRSGRRAIMRGGRRPGHRLSHLAGALDLPTAPLPVAWMAEEDRALAARLLPAGGGEGGAEGGPWIGLGPTANWPAKIWPAERFVALFHGLATRLPGARAVVFGGPGAADREAARPVLAALPGAVDLVGQLSLAESAACLAACTLFVGNDSGLMHLAASAGTPTLGLFGPTPASEYAPAGRCTAVALAEGPPGAAPMTSLPVQAALLAGLDMLQEAGRVPAGEEKELLF
jgi:ADP-heptose:LPS heptosyltransferase